MGCRGLVPYRGINPLVCFLLIIRSDLWDGMKKPE